MSIYHSSAPWKVVVFFFLITTGVIYWLASLTNPRGLPITKSISIPMIGGKLKTIGSINGSPTEIIVDPSLSYSAISSTFAQRNGILGCRENRTVLNGNGLMTTCISAADTIVIGPFHLSNQTIVILPNMRDDAVIGQNTLGCFVTTLQPNSIHLGQFKGQRCR